MTVNAATYAGQSIDWRDRPLTWLWLRTTGRRKRLALTAAEVIAFVAVSAVRGLPIGGYWPLVWITVLALVQGTDRFSHRIGAFARDWIPLLAILCAYSGIGYYAAKANPHIHVWTQVHFDRAIAFGAVPTVWLQHHLYVPGRVAPWDTFLTCVYLTHFLATFLVGLAIWRRDRVDFGKFRRLYLITTLAGFLTYIAYPAAPPWIASEHAIPHVYHVVTNVLHSSSAQQIVASTSAPVQTRLYDPYAAVPSMHAAYPLMLCLFLWTRWRRARPLLVAYPLFMALALVYTGEHYVFDILVGWLYAVGFFLLCKRIDRFIERRKLTRLERELIRVTDDETADSLDSVHVTQSSRSRLSASNSV